jgi:hypothetical protein
MAACIGYMLEDAFPAPKDWDAVTKFPIHAEHVDAISDYITLVVAEILQAWLDAGSERDVTLEELGPHITDHVKGWSEA